MNLDEVNWDAMRFGFDVSQLVFMAGVTIYVWWKNRSTATKSAIEEVDSKVTVIKRDLDVRLNKLNQRVSLTEQNIKHLPDHEDLGAIHEKVNEVARTMSEMSGELRGMNRTLTLMNDYFINGGKDK